MWRHILAFSCIGSLTAFAQTNPQQELSLDLGSGLQLELVLILPGSFQQGAPTSEPGREDDETQRQVTITEPYYIGKYPVTRGQFARFVETTRHRTDAERGESGGYGVVDGKLTQRPGFSWRNPGFSQTDDHPVVIVTAQDAKAFSQWLGKRSGRTVALPTEAQWEYACRAGTTGAHYLEPLDSIGWHRGNSGGQTHLVGEKKPNAWGLYDLYDLYGPVWQWCSDWYAPYPSGPATDPLQTNRNLSDKPRQVLRGGSFISGDSHARSASRYRNDPLSRNADNGFRIVCSATVREPTPAASSSSALIPAADSASHLTPDIAEAEIIDESVSASGSWDFFSIAFIGIFLLVFVGAFGLIGYGILKAIFGAFRPKTPGPIPGSNFTPGQAADFFSSQPPPLSQRFNFNLTDSGFFIIGPEEAVGTQVQYTADLGDQVMTDDILFSPGPEGHFIFTGTRPKGVTVRTLGGMAGTTSDTTFSSFDSGSSRRSSFGSSSSRRSYPSAY